jgi:alpha-beta hydrolase superfamily lysophospholipase
LNKHLNDKRREKMLKFVLSILGAVALALPVAAQVHPFPTSFRTQNIQTDGATLYVRVGGKGPAVVFLHGFGDTGDMWAPLAADLVRDHTVVVPDLRGMGLSSHPSGGYDKRTQAADIRSVLTKLGLDRAVVVGTTSALWLPMPMQRAILIKL